MKFNHNLSDLKGKHIDNINAVRDKRNHVAGIIAVVEDEYFLIDLSDDSLDFQSILADSTMSEELKGLMEEIVSNEMLNFVNCRMKDILVDVQEDTKTPKEKYLNFADFLRDNHIHPVLFLKNCEPKNQGWGAKPPYTNFEHEWNNHKRHFMFNAFNWDKNILGLTPDKLNELDNQWRNKTREFLYSGNNEDHIIFEF